MPLPRKYAARFPNVRAREEMPLVDGADLFHLGREQSRQRGLCGQRAAWDAKGGRANKRDPGILPLSRTETHASPDVSGRPGSW